MRNIAVLVIFLVTNVYCGSIIIEGPKSVTLHSGRDTVLTCLTKPSNVSVTWRMNSKNLTLPDQWRRIGKLGKYHTLNITNISLPLTGGYSCAVKNESGFILEESKTAFVLIDSGCNDSKINCGFVEKCIKQKDICNNKNDCGDLWDEKLNCKPPNKLGWRSVEFYGYTRLQIHYITFSSSRNYTTVIKVMKNNKLINKKEAYPVEGIRQDVFIDGVQNGTTYAVSLQAVNIVGVGSEIIYHNVTIPKASLPKVPPVLRISFIDYNGISVELFDYPGPIINYTTTFKIVDGNGQKAADDVVLTDSKVNAALGKGKLKNGTEYFITIESSNFIGRSLKPLNVSYKIPRMVPPGPIQNMKVKVKNTYSDFVYVEIDYERPIDDGGSADLTGKLKNCKVDGSGRLNDCKTKSISLGRVNSSYEVFDLPDNTKFYFEIYMMSKVDQKGESASIFYTTPAKESAHHDKISGEMIAIYVSVGFLGCSIILSLIAYFGKRWLRNRQNVPYARQT